LTPTHPAQGRSAALPTVSGQPLAPCGDNSRSRRAELEGGSRIGARYRHTTPEMAVRVVAAIQERLVIVVQVAEAVLELDDSGGRVF
jgi:hypothetical protein